MKKLAVLVALSGACAVAHAADEGWVDGADANGASGWACDSAWPYHQEYVHVYRDDGPFLGAIYAGNLREQAVADRCGGHPYHGFSGPLSYSSNLIDGKKHNVHFYFIRGDGSHFEIPGSPKLVQFGSPPPPPRIIKTCANPYLQPGPTWFLVAYGEGLLPGVNCGVGGAAAVWQNFDQAAYAYPSGTRVSICGPDSPPGWIKVGRTELVRSRCYTPNGYGWMKVSWYDYQKS